MTLKATVFDAVCQPQALNTEYPIFAVGSGVDTTHKFYSAYIDLSLLQTGDVIQIVVGATISSTGSNKVIINEEFTGEQAADRPLYYISPLPNWFGMQISLNMTAGTTDVSKFFPYLILES
jgi:hypothetical protein